MLNRWLKHKSTPLVTRWFGLIFFLFLFLLLVFGTVRIIFLDLTSSWAMFIIWTLWWPFLYITILLIARGWCGFLCPIGLFNEWGNKIKFRRTTKIFKYGALPFVLFFLVVLTEQIGGLFLSVPMTLLFIGLFFLLAFVFGIFWKRLSFCKMICPIGTLLSVFSRLSFFGVRVNKRKCDECKTKECLTGTSKANQCPMFNNVPKLDTNKDCLLCTNCIKNCPHDSAQLGFLFPGKEVAEKNGFNIKESLFIVALLGFTITLTTNGTSFLRLILSIFGVSFNGGILRFFDFFLAIGLTIGVFLLINKVISVFNKENFKDLVKDLGYLFLPLVFSIFLFVITFGFLHEWIPFSDFQIAIAKYILLFLGSAWGAYLLFKISDSKLVRGIYSLILLGLLLSWVFLLIPGPMNLVDVQEEFYIYGGEDLPLDMFSMGYYPKNIVVKKGDLVKFDLVNKDIDHAFDIDEFDIHSIISGGESEIIEFTADKVGEYDYYCSIPGHEEAGMKGKLIVEE